MIPNDYQWFSLIPNDSKWSLMIPNNPQWLHMIPNDSQWTLMISNDPRWSQMFYITKIQSHLSGLLGLFHECLLRFRSVRTSSNYLILSLSLSDFLMQTKVTMAIINAVYGGPQMGITGAKVNITNIHLNPFTWSLLGKYDFSLNLQRYITIQRQ